ncbi:MAG: hypothetical protein ACI4V1_07890, partial [Eubacteriales bacterium]
TMIQYFSALASIKNAEERTGPLPSDEHSTRHLHALSLLADGKTAEAVKILRELSLDPTLPYYMKYRVLCGLEESATALGDFRLAYSSSRRKLELIEKCRSSDRL